MALDVFKVSSSRGYTEVGGEQVLSAESLDGMSRAVNDHFVYLTFLYSGKRR